MVRRIVPIAAMLFVVVSCTKGSSGQRSLPGEQATNPGLIPLTTTAPPATTTPPKTIKPPKTTTPPKTTAPPEPNCDPNYTGACLDPNAEDYDCFGGSGNGPLYVKGPIYVVGVDHYDLDRDGNGVACE